MKTHFAYGKSDTALCNVNRAATSHDPWADVTCAACMRHLKKHRSWMHYAHSVLRSPVPDTPASG